MTKFYFIKIFITSNLSGGSFLKVDISMVKKRSDKTHTDLILTNKPSQDLRLWKRIKWLPLAVNKNQ